MKDFKWNLQENVLAPSDNVDFSITVTYPRYNFRLESLYAPNVEVVFCNTHVGFNMNSREMRALANALVEAADVADANEKELNDSIVAKKNKLEAQKKALTDAIRHAVNPERAVLEEMLNTLDLA